MVSSAAKWWAFGQMQFGHRQLSHVNGQQFYKLMGSGRGFSPWPDWSTFVLLQAWQNEAAAQQFFERHPFFQKYKRKSSTTSTVYATNTKSHGTWDGLHPFEPKKQPSGSPKPIMVLTRATIKKKWLIKFWSYVPISQRPISHAAGLIYTKGVGEWPLTQMATLSFWKNEEAMKDYAFGSEGHKKAIKLTKELNWYKEELFARFTPYKIIGDFEGLIPIDL